MRHTTIGALLDEDVDTTGYSLYVVKNGEGEVLYVGQSSNICSRIQGHTPRTSLLGKALSANHPQSQQWEVDLYTTKECMDRILHYFPHAPNPSQWGWASTPKAWEDLAEDTLIHDLVPRYNLITNVSRHRPTPFTQREVHPEVQAWYAEKKKAEEESARRQRQKLEEQHAFLVNSVCSICGEHDQYQYHDGEPCGVLPSVTVFRGEERIEIPLVCHDCNKIINMLDELEKRAALVRKVQEAIESARTRRAANT